MGQKRLIAACGVIVLFLSGGSPLQALGRPSNNECDTELNVEETWGDCPRSFNANTPQKIRQKINASGLLCVKPKSVGRDKNGGSFLQCTIDNQTITILSWPTTAGPSQFLRGSFSRDYSNPQSRKSKWTGCAWVLLRAPRYAIWIPAQDASLKADGEFVVALRQALGIPRYAKRNDGGQVLWYTQALAPAVSGAAKACGV
jgi:hypothetical protein